MKPEHGRPSGSVPVSPTRGHHQKFGSRREAAQHRQGSLRLFAINRSIPWRRSGGELSFVLCASATFGRTPSESRSLNSGTASESERLSGYETEKLSND